MVHLMAIVYYSRDVVMWKVQRMLTGFHSAHPWVELRYLARVMGRNWVRLKCWVQVMGHHLVGRRY